MEERAWLTRWEQRDESMLTFEASPMQGVASIIEKLSVWI